MELVMPVFAALIIIFGIIKRVAVFDEFIAGAKEGFATLYTIAPSILGLVFAVSLLKTSGAVDVICSAVKPVADFLGFPNELVPMAPTALPAGSRAFWRAQARRHFTLQRCITGAYG